MKTNNEKLIQELTLIFAFFIFVLAIITTIIKAKSTTTDPYIYHSVPYEEVAVVSATVYHATRKECDKRYWETSTGLTIDTLHPDKYRFVAVSRDFLNGKNKELQLEFGDTIQVDGTWTYDGLWIVVDKKHKRYKNHIDFLIAKGQFVHKWDSCVVIRKYKNNQ